MDISGRHYYIEFSAITRYFQKCYYYKLTKLYIALYFTVKYKYYNYLDEIFYNSQFYIVYDYFSICQKKKKKIIKKIGSWVRYRSMK
jgi:hypothetical protein